MLPITLPVTFPTKLANNWFSTVTSLLNITLGVNVIADEFSESIKLVNILPVIDVPLIVPDTASTNNVLSSANTDPLNASALREP